MGEAFSQTLPMDDGSGSLINFGGLDAESDGRIGGGLGSPNKVPDVSGNQGIKRRWKITVRLDACPRKKTRKIGGRSYKCFCEIFDSERAKVYCSFTDNR